MHAIVAERPGTPDVLSTYVMPDPEPREGWVTIRVRGFGLNRIELDTRRGHNPEVGFPRILGIECVGTVADAPGTTLRRGQKVAAVRGGMGSHFDGSYADFTQVPESCVIPLETSLDWSVLAAVPEMFRTASGALHRTLDARPGQSLLIRGGASSIGMTAATLANAMGLQVCSTTRSPDKRAALEAVGAHHVIIDDGSVAEQVKAIYPDGVDRILELVGAATLVDSLAAASEGSVVCLTGALGTERALEGFNPLVALEKGIKLTVFTGDRSAVSAADLQQFVDGVATGRNRIRIDRVFGLDEVAQAHRYMETNQAVGKVVVAV